eukprot:TRINITY_DN1613_c0_g1_i1.p1 TRINITY_DN1613_c0_g1~~TRINITY_DN1613_c0_g1_i1.p1  ORF type:complete len:319 (+),score=65.57 TRINITY_DN1613_c0_g1_i1:51-1007(+)
MSSGPPVRPHHPLRHHPHHDHSQLPLSVSFSTAGLGGVIGWIVVHPANTIAVRMNLAKLSGGATNLNAFAFAKNIVSNEGVGALYRGLSAGIVRQVFYASSRFGLFEVFRDRLAKYRKTDFWSRLAVGVASGGCAALIACPAEVSLVRMSNDLALPKEQRRNYTSVVNAAVKITRDEGVKTFWRGSMPFVNRAMLVGATQMATYDQFKELYHQWGIHSRIGNEFASAMSAGLLYSVITMPFETVKNRMAFQKPDPVTKELVYKGTLQSLKLISAKEGIASLWSGFLPYYVRSGGHTVVMFIAVEELRDIYWSIVDKDD